MKDKEISKTERQRRILKAIGSGNHLVRGISHTTEINSVVVLNELEEMQGTTVEYVKMGTFTAWFLAGKSPKGKIVLDGKGGIVQVDETKAW